MALGGRWSFMRALEKIDSKTADSIKEKLKSRSGSFGRLTSLVAGVPSLSKINDLKIGKTSGPGATFSKVVEEAKKKAEDMRDQLKQIITMTRGMSAWDELLKTEADIRKRRQKAIYDQEEYRRKVLEWIAIGLLAIGVTVAITFVIWLGLKNRGLI